MKKSIMFLVLFSLFAVPVMAAGFGGALTRSGGSNANEWYEAHMQGYILSTNWIETHGAKLESNMSIVNSVKDKEYQGRNSEIWLKTVNKYGIIKDYNGKKVAYEVDKFRVDCPDKSFGVFETLLYGQDGEIIATLNKNSGILMSAYGESKYYKRNYTIKPNIAAFGKMLDGYVCKE